MESQDKERRLRHSAQVLEFGANSLMAVSIQGRGSAQTDAVATISVPMQADSNVTSGVYIFKMLEMLDPSISYGIDYKSIIKFKKIGE